MALISKSPTMPVMDKRSSSPQSTSVGSGSRPVPSRKPIATSAPTDAHTLGRVDGVDWLK